MALRVINLSKNFSAKKVLKNINIDFPPSGLICISGRSGSGKTTLLRLIAGLEIPDSGSVEGLEDKRISYVFQNDRLLPGFTALENVAIVSDPETALLWLKRFELGDAISKKPKQLSGGMQRRVALARAMAYAKDGDILLLDEPFKGLDADLKSKIIPYIQDFSQKNLVLLVTHDEKEASLTDACIFINEIQTIFS